MRAGSLNDEIDSTAGDIVGHERALSVILALAGKAIITIQVTGMGNVEAKRFDIGFAIAEVEGQMTERIFREKALIFNQSGKII